MTAGPRVIHGYSPAGNAVVRYERAGKYFVEGHGARFGVTLATAVEFISDPDGSWCEGAAGGMRLDAEVRKAIARRKSAASSSVLPVDAKQAAAGERQEP